MRKVLLSGSMYIAEQSIQCYVNRRTKRSKTRRGVSVSLVSMNGCIGPILLVSSCGGVQWGSACESCKNLTVERSLDQLENSFRGLGYFN